MAERLQESGDRFIWASGHLDICHRKYSACATRRRGRLRSTILFGIGFGIGWPLGGPRVAQASPKGHAGAARASNGRSTFICNKKVKKAGGGQDRAGGPCFRLLLAKRGAFGEG